MWIVRYTSELFSWAFARWRVHQALVGLAVIVFGGIGVVSVSATTPRTVALYLAAWFVLLFLIVAPARLWHSLEVKLRPALAFVDHPDDEAFDPNSGVQYARVTVKNTSAVLLTQVQLTLETIEPWPEGFMTLNVPLHPMHSPPDDSTFALSPGTHRSVDVVSLWHNNPGADLWHSVPSVPQDLPLGTYRFKLVASAAETTPVERWFSVVAERTQNSQHLAVVMETDAA